MFDGVTFKDTANFLQTTCTNRAEFRGGTFQNTVFFY